MEHWLKMANAFKNCASVFLNLFYDESLYQLLCSCVNATFGKNLVREIWTKMFSANLVAGFLNQLYFQNKLIKLPYF